MADEQEPAKRVVKRVVKKTVVRPAERTPNPPTVRYGRPVATATRPKAKAAPRPAGTPTTPPAGQKAPRTRTTLRRPNLALGAKAAGARALTGRVWWAAADTTRDVTTVLARRATTGARTVAGWRLPHLNAYLASVITGAVVGLVAALLGAAALAIFESVRGVAAGGGLWGGLTFIVLAVAVVLAGEALLRGFGTPSARVKSCVAVILAIVAMLGLFLDLADSAAALVLLPVLGAAAYLVSNWLVDLGENAPTVVE
ncbi:hypothetical protein [Aeromicrobium wangtongii]|uniref:hypothetical protein n=1 Tax=Aeromicrobium wangtongii TaxID=2969247 RepID=UPI0020171855|nr:hypothetical protein [Aeromicrobium wangtongii]MCL3817348.1 hypothetical protein [Aeromicrobium wangtongii]